jgi:hypothetical protein
MRLERLPLRPKGRGLPVRNVRGKVLAASWIQWGTIALLALAAIPPAAMVFRAHEISLAIARDHLTWEMIGIFGTIFMTAMVQIFVFRDGCFGVCAFPPLTPVGPVAVFWCRVGTQGLFWLALTVGTLTVLRSLPMHLGLVLSTGLFCLNAAVFNGLCLALGFEQVVPPLLRFFFPLDERWILSRMRGRIRSGERSCVAALRDASLVPEKRLLAMELIALRPWVPGGLQALREISNAEGMEAPLAARACEILSSETVNSLVASTGVRGVSGLPLGGASRGRHRP